MLDSFDLDHTNVGLIVAKWDSDPMDASIAQCNKPAIALFGSLSGSLLDLLNELQVEGGREDYTGQMMLSELIQKGKISLNCTFRKKPLCVYAVYMQDCIQISVTDPVAFATSESEVSDFGLLSLGRQTSSIVHDIQGPLMILDYHTDLMLQSKEGLSADKSRTTFGLFRNSIDHLKALVQSILTVAGGKEGPFEEVQIKAFLDKWYEMKSDKPLRPNIVINVISCDNSVLVQQVAIKRVLSNLFENAVEATKSIEDSENVISIIAEPYDDEHISITVEDSGPGVDEDLMQKLFNFGVTGKSNGYGIGLYGCRLSVERHGGKIWYERVEDKTRFIITLPKA